MARKRVLPSNPVETQAVWQESSLNQGAISPATWPPATKSEKTIEKWGIPEKSFQNIAQLC